MVRGAWVQPPRGSHARIEVVAEGYREPSLTPEAEAELADRERLAELEPLYQKAWRRHARSSRNGPVALAVGVVWGLVAVAAAVLGHLAVAVGLLGGVLVAGVALVGIRPVRCPRCGAAFSRLKDFRLERRCPRCSLRPGQLPQHGIRLRVDDLTDEIAPYLTPWRERVVKSLWGPWALGLLAVGFVLCAIALPLLAFVALFIVLIAFELSIVTVSSRRVVCPKCGANRRIQQGFFQRLPSTCPECNLRVGELPEPKE